MAIDDNMKEANKGIEKIQAKLDEEVIDLREYWRVLRRHQYSILGLAFVAVLLAALVVFSMTPIYSSTSTLLIEAEKSNIVSIEEVYGVGNGNAEYFQTQYGILRSRQLAKMVIDKLKLADHPEFAEEEGGFSWRDLIPVGSDDSTDEAEAAAARMQELITDFQERLNIAPVRKSYLVNISFEANDRMLAAKVANALAEMYIESDLEARLQMTTKASGWLTKRLEGLREKLKASEEELQRYREQENLLESGGKSELTAKHIQELNEKLVSAQQRRALTEATYKQVQELKGKSWESYLSVPAVLNDPLVGNLKQAESEAKRKVSALSKRYGPKHPKMIQMKADLAEARANVRKRVQSVISGIEKEYRVASAEQSSVSSVLESTKGEMQQINRKGYRLGILEREVEANKQLYDMFMGRYKETSETAGLESVRARITDYAVPALKPAKPKKKLIILIAGFLGLFVGVLLAFLIEHLDNTIKLAVEMEEKLGLPVLGILPHLELNADSGETPLKYSREHKQSFFAESVRTVRTGILLSGLDDPHKIIVVTSSVPSEGKSTIAMNLADSLSDMNKVLLLDADMRRPSVGKNFGIKAGANGLSEFVSKSAKSDECIYQINNSNLYVMPSGVIPPNPLELLSSKTFGEALEELANTFDHIVIDSAPTLAVSDALVLSNHASGVIYVTKSDTTPIPAAQEGLKRLRKANAHLIGGVLNEVNPKKGLKAYAGYGEKGYYAGNYYGSYGYSQDQAEFGK
jgi:capsular exopolysaccharide synthesis family protein